MFIGILVVAIGLIWLLNSLGVISASIWSIVLPVAVILAGFSMMGKYCTCGKCMFCKNKSCSDCKSCCGSKCDVCKDKDAGKMQ